MRSANQNKSSFCTRPITTNQIVHSAKRITALSLQRAMPKTFQRMLREGNFALLFRRVRIKEFSSAKSNQATSHRSQRQATDPLSQAMPSQKPCKQQQAKRQNPIAEPSSGPSKLSHAQPWTLNPETNARLSSTLPMKRSNF